MFDELINQPMDGTHETKRLIRKIYVRKVAQLYRIGVTSSEKIHIKNLIFIKIIRVHTPVKLLPTSSFVISTFKLKC